MTQQTASWTRHDGIATLSPSEKLVYLVLAEDAPLTQKELIETTRLPERTVRAAVSKLRDQSVVTRRQSLQDARQHLYNLADSGDGAGEADDEASGESRNGSGRRRGSVRRRAGGSR